MPGKGGIHTRRKYRTQRGCRRNGIYQPQHDYTRFIVESNGITHDLKPTIDRIYSGKLYTFRHDGTIYHNDKGLLPPLKDGNVYKEYVHIVNPQNATRPGPMRIVIGNNGIWFTPDYYIK